VDSVADRAMDQLFDLAVVLGDLMNARLVQHGLTPARAEVLWVLHGRGPLTQRELSQILKCTPRNVTGLVDVLLHAGLVDRVPHPSDRRAVQVSLSKQGRALLDGWSAERKHGTAGVLGDIAPAELAIFTDVLDRVLRNLRSTYLSA
jgi:DNA-binding MarR family transcriptional regulator